MCTFELHSGKLMQFLTSKEKDRSLDAVGTAEGAVSESELDLDSAAHPGKWTGTLQTLLPV